MRIANPQQKGVPTKPKALCRETASTDILTRSEPGQLWAHSFERVTMDILYKLRHLAVKLGLKKWTPEFPLPDSGALPEMWWTAEDGFIVGKGWTVTDVTYAEEAHFYPKMSESDIREVHEYLADKYDIDLETDVLWEHRCYVCSYTWVSRCRDEECPECGDLHIYTVIHD